MPEWTKTQVTNKTSPRSVADTVSRLTGILSDKDIRLFTVIDQHEAAIDAGLNLRETVLVIFGSPAAGTPVMDAVPLAALDLPLKVLIWDDGGVTTVSYYGPGALAARYGLDRELEAKLAGLDPLTDEVVAA
jgi:uncharacterized protein (DUF302 family)